jgi:hypothetical protein
LSNKKSDTGGLVGVAASEENLVNAFGKGLIG